MAYLEITGVDKVFGTDGKPGQKILALEGINFAVEQGEIYALLGPSGCGKSTILEIVAGFERPTRGTVLFDGARITGPEPERAMVFQQPNLFPWLTVIDNVMFGPRVQGQSDMRAAAKRAGHLLEICGLGGFEKRYPYQLSGGMRQRVAIVRVLMNNPRVLLMDEPFGALDALTRLTMQELLLAIWGELKPTIIFVTHDVDEALFLADRVGVMSRRPGRMKREVRVEIGRPRDVDVMITPKFTALKSMLIHELRNEAQATDGAPQDHTKILTG